MLLTRLIFDFGLLVLIWLVQLVIYPGFKYYSPANLKIWHQIYTGRITLVVVPLMLGQLGTAGWQLWTAQNLYTVGTFVIILSIWGITFFIFVPLHSAIEENPANSTAIKDLVHKNRIRTVLWTGIFFWSLLKFL